jgi:hypothetical protein
VHTDLDTLATALYVKIDDVLKEAPQLCRWRPPAGIAPRLTDAELLTLAVMQALLGYTSEARWLRYAHKQLRHLFPYLPGQAGDNKRLRAAVAQVKYFIWASPCCDRPTPARHPGPAHTCSGRFASSSSRSMTPSRASWTWNAMAVAPSTALAFGSCNGCSP